MQLENYKHILAGGCSFTADGIGGMPPTKNSDGGCSFVDYSATPKSWASILAKRMQVNSLVNLAGHGHGNMYLAYTLLEILSNFNYVPSNTLILFNITQPYRFDVPCSFDHPAASTNVSWTQELIPHSYIHPTSKLNTHFVKNIGFEQVEQMSANSLRFLFNFLENKNFTFYFLMLENYLDHPVLGPIIKEYKKNLIALDPGIGMVEFSRIKNLESDDKFHPTVEGYGQIADRVYDYLEKIE